MCECISRKTQIHVCHMKIVRFRLYICIVNTFIDIMFFMQYIKYSSPYYISDTV